MKKMRLDILMLERGLADTINRARALIMAGQVVVADHTVDKSGQQVATDVDIRLKGDKHSYVSRGGLKLHEALVRFGINVSGLVAIDIGSSTGGFTDCLLQAGVARVFAVDVGYGQLAWKLQNDPRVVSMERTNIRTVTRDQLDMLPQLAVIDASFISLSKILPAAVDLITPGGMIIALIKPQFEAGRGEVGKGGIVRDRAVHEKVISDVSTAAVCLGLRVSDLCESPITGADGNREFLILLHKPDIENEGALHGKLSVL